MKFWKLDVFPPSGDRGKTPTLSKGPKKTFWKLDLFPSSGDGRKKPTPSRGHNLKSHMKTDPISKTFWFIVFITPDNGQSPEPQYF
jgi:hypothetical protein